MRLEPGMRVRCVDAMTYGRKHPKLTQGKEYSVISAGREYATIVDDAGERGGWLKERFKPVVRVKARSRVVVDKCCNKTVRMRCEGCPLNTYPAGYRGFETVAA